MYSLTKLNRWLVRSPQMQEGYLPCPTSGMCVCMCVCVCMYVCVCVCVYASVIHTHTHVHTHTSIYATVTYIDRQAGR